MRDALLTVMSFKLFVAYLLVVVVSPGQILMELCVIDGDDEAIDSGDDGCTPKSAVSSGLAFNTAIHQRERKKQEIFSCWICLKDVPADTGKGAKTLTASRKFCHIIIKTKTTSVSQCQGALKCRE